MEMIKQFITFELNDKISGNSKANR